MNNITFNKIMERLINNWRFGHSILTLICVSLLLIPIIAGKYLDAISNIALIFFGINCLIGSIMDAIIETNDGQEY